MTTKRRRTEQRRNKVSARRAAEQHKSGFESKCFKIPEGKRVFIVKQEGVKKLDIIPYIVPEGANNPNGQEGELHFERTYFAHRDVGSDGDMYPCLRKTFNKPCPICDYRAGLLKDPDADENLVKTLAPKERQLWNVFDHDDEDKGVQIWEVSYHLFGRMLNARVINSDEEDGYEFFADPEEGMTLKIGFSEGTFGKSKYFETATIDFKARSKPLDEELVEQAEVLDSLLNHYTYDELKEIFLQTKEEEKEDEPIREGKKSKKKVKEDEDDIEDDEDEEEEEEETEDEEDDEEDDDEEEEESPPKKENAPRGLLKCTACKGSGKNSKGKSCPICKGNGLVPKEEEEDDEEEEEPAPKKPVSTAAAKSGKVGTSASTASHSKAKAKTSFAVGDTVDHDEYGECKVVKIGQDGVSLFVVDSDGKKHPVRLDSISLVDNEDEDEEEEDAPKPKSKTKSKSGKATDRPVKETEEEDWDWEDEE